MASTFPQTTATDNPATDNPEPLADDESTGRRLALVVEYDGSGYAGFQFQPGQPTVQGELEKALTRFTQETIRVRGASRTDSGAHARGQVVDFWTCCSHPVQTFPKALNFYLPQDIRVQAAHAVPRDFHSRLHANRRTYRYQVLNSTSASALKRRRWHWVDAGLNVAKMAGAAQTLVGWHDFRALAPGLPADKNSDRLVSRWDVWREDEAVIFECEANGFLKHQIRRANGLLLEVGKGRRPASVVDDVLSGRAGNDVAWPSLPARGLCLMKVTYPDFPPLSDGAAREERTLVEAGPERETVR